MPRFRPTARLLVLDPAGRILLFSAQDPRGRFWFTPGGAVHGGETLTAAAVRELGEETGHVLAEADLGPVVATRAGLWSTTGGQTFFGADSFFLVQVAESSLNADRQEPLERSVITGHRWWTTGDLRASDEVIVPAGLGELVEALLREGALAAPRSLPWRAAEGLRGQRPRTVPSGEALGITPPRSEASRQRVAGGRAVPEHW
jgi:8-oxo-dGTP pyrophosphatase MutT (NUDIX family)